MKFTMAQCNGMSLSGLQPMDTLGELGKFFWNLDRIFPVKVYYKWLSKAAPLQRCFLLCYLLFQNLLGNLDGLHLCG